MSITIMRQVKFCAGHRLLNHEGKCANLHGHNYLVEFHVTGNEVDSLGRVVDFSVLNKLFKGWIDENWDHGFVLWDCLLYTSPSPRDQRGSRMPSSA